MHFTFADIYSSPQKTHDGRTWATFVIRRCVEASDAHHISAVEASLEPRGPVIKCDIPYHRGTRTKASRTYSNIPPRGTEKCESRSRANTPRGGHIPYKEYRLVPGIAGSSGISSRSPKGVTRDTLMKSITHHRCSIIRTLGQTDSYSVNLRHPAHVAWRESYKL